MVGFFSRAIIDTGHLRVKIFLINISVGGILMFYQIMRFSFYIYLFFILSFGSYKSFAGADPDELTLEQEQALQKDEVFVEKPKEEVVQEVSSILKNCVSFPEAIAYKEHFACSGDIEKNRIARMSWSFTKLLLK